MHRWVAGWGARLAEAPRLNPSRTKPFRTKSLRTMPQPLMTNKPQDQAATPHGFMSHY